MKWRIVLVLVAVVVPPIVEALRDGRVTSEELESLGAALVEALDKLSGS